MRVAFLRGINVGGHQVKKGTFVEVFSGLGFTDVSTFIASGNVLFDHKVSITDAEMEDIISAGLQERLGWEVPAFVRSPDEIAAIAGFRSEPTLTPSEGETLYIGLCRDAPDRATTTILEAFTGPTDVVQVRGREIYWLCRGPVHSSKTAPKIERAVVRDFTQRNITTMCRLADRFRGT